MQISAAVNQAADFIRSQTNETPPVGIVLGSGLSSIGDAFQGLSLPYAEIPGMPRSTVAGHRGVLKIGPKAAVFMGRFHFYEGYPLGTVVFPILLMKKLGVKTVVLTNAAGGIKKDFFPGQLVLISDHINLLGSNPFVGPHDPEWGLRFFDMTTTYTPKLRQILRKLGEDHLGLSLQEGVYAAMTGPSYETPAEIRFLGTIGADLVGMSTVPEAIAARSCGLDLAAVSCVTNLAAGLGQSELDHNEVILYGKKAEKDLETLLKTFVDHIVP